MNILILIMGCSFVGFPRSRCEDHQACRDAFGLGSTCGEKGFCEAPRDMPRCGSFFPEDLLLLRDAHADTLVVGSIYDHNREWTLVQSTRLAVQQAAEVSGQRVGIVECDAAEDASLDSRSSTQAAVDAAAFLSGDLQVGGIVGMSSTTQLTSVFESLDAAAAVLVSPAATGLTLTALEAPATDESPGRLWRTAPSDARQAAAIVQDLADRGVIGATVIYHDSAAPAALAEALTETSTAELELVPYLSAAERDSAVLDAAFDVGTKEIVVLPFDVSDAASFLNKAAIYTAFETKELLFSAVAASPTFLEFTQGATNLHARVRGVRFVPPDGRPLYETFDEELWAALGQRALYSPWSAHAYDAGWLVLSGMAWAAGQEDTVDGPGVARGLREVSDGAASQVGASGWSALSATLGSGTSVDLSGASGELDFDPSTEEPAVDTEIWHIKAGAIVAEEG